MRYRGALLPTICKYCCKTALGEKTSSYRQWVQAIADYGQTLQTPAQACAPGPIDTLLASRYRRYGTCAFAAELQNEGVQLSEALTDVLLHQANAAFHTDINDLLLAALALAFERTFAKRVNHIVLKSTWA